MMREEQNAVDPNTGDEFNVGSGAQKDWMNQHGEYDGTSDVLTDPTVGNNSDHQWREVKMQQ